MQDSVAQNREAVPELESATPVEETAPAPQSWRFWLPRIATAILTPPLLLVGLELCLRLLDVGYSTELMQPCTVHGRPSNCYNLFFPAPFFPPGMIKAPQVYSFPLEKSKNTYRIVVLGESAAMGDPDPAYSFSRYLEVMLKQRFPSMNFEIANTGSVAINSHVSLLIAKGLAALQPDIFILYLGNNEVVGPYGPGTALSASGMNLQVIRSSIFLRSTHIGQLFTKLGAQKQQWRGMEMFLDKQVPKSSPLMKYTYSNFYSNLRDTIAVARASGARVIVSTVATNLKDCAPFASQHRSSLRQEDLQKWSSLVDEGARLEATGAYDQAVNTYLAGTRIDDQYAELDFRIARVLWKTGDYGSALQYFSRARDLDTLRFRADSRINQINRSAAAAGSGTDLLDAEAIFNRNSPNGVTGSDLVYEHVHLTSAGNYLLAREMFRNIAGQIAGRPVQENDMPSQAECERLLAFTRYDRYRIANEMFQRLQRPPFTNQLNHADQELRLAMEAQAPVESPDQTAAEYRAAIAQRPNDRVLRYNFGLFLFNFDKDAAAEQLKLSQPWDGFPVFAPDGTQLE